MNSVNGLFSAVVSASVVSVIARLLVPSKKRTVMSMMLGVFTLCVIAQPLCGIIDDMRSFKFNISGGDTQTSDIFRQNACELTASLGCEQIKEITAQKLDDFGVKNYKITVNCSTNSQSGVITVQSICIQLSKDQRCRKVQVEQYIKNQTGIETVVTVNEGGTEN